MLTGHGPLGDYLVRFGLSEDDTCRFCGEDTESVEHFIEGCLGTELRLPRKVDSEEELTQLIENSAMIVGRLRKCQTGE